MALNGSVSTNQYDGKVGLTCTWTALQDAAANKSVISWTLTSDGSQYYTYETGNLKLDIGGIRVLQIDSRFNMQGGGHWSRSGTLELPHNPDGTKSFTINISAGIWYYTSSNCTGSGTFTLNPFPRASSATVPNFTVGTGGTVSISRASSDFTHTLSVQLGDGVYEIASGIGDSCHWTPEAAVWGPRIPGAASAACTMIVDTYHGGTHIGRTAYSFALYIPADIVPTVSELAVLLQNDNPVVRDWGVAVKGYTRLAWSASAEGAYGSSITDYAFSAGGLTGSGASGTTGILQTAGSVTPSVRVTDSRGRTAGGNAAAIHVYDYAAPNISDANAYRCDGSGNADESGTNVRITLTAHISSVGGRNSAVLHYRFRQAGGSFTGWAEFTSGAILSGFDTAKSYEFELRTVDSLGQAKTASITVPTESVWLNGRDGGKGAAFGKYAEEDNLLDVAWNSRFRGSVTFDTLPAQVAPSGYGYGEVSAFIYIAGDTDGAQTTAQIENDFAALGDGKSKRITICDPSSLMSVYAYEGKLYRLNANEGSLELFGGDGIAVKRNKLNGTWQPWEWVNPPMHAGVEYRTTERWNGSPVYTKLVDCGAWVPEKQISVDTGTGIKHYTGNVQDIALPFTGYSAYNRDDPYMAWIEANSGFIALRGGSGFTGRQTYVQLWYTR